MLDKISLFFILIWLLFPICPLHAQGTQPDVALEITKLNEQIQKLNEQIQELNERIQKLEKGNYEYVSPKIKEELTIWYIGIAGFFGVVIAVITFFGGKAYVELKVMQYISGKEKRFDDALKDIEASRQEIEATKKQVTDLRNEAKEIQYNQVRYILAKPGGFWGNLAKYLPLESVLRALKEAESDELILIPSAIEVLGLRKYQDAVPEILKYLNSDCEFLYIVMQALERIGTREACKEIIDFLENLFEKLQDDSLSIVARNALLDQIRESISTLGEMRRPETIPALEKAALEYEDFRVDGFVAIYKIEGERAKAALNKILEAITDIENFREMVRIISSDAAKYIDEWQV